MVGTFYYATSTECSQKRLSKTFLENPSSSEKFANYIWSVWGLSRLSKNSSPTNRWIKFFREPRSTNSSARHVYIYKNIITISISQICDNHLFIYDYLLIFLKDARSMFNIIENSTAQSYKYQHLFRNKLLWAEHLSNHFK